MIVARLYCNVIRELTNEHPYSWGTMIVYINPIEPRTGWLNFFSLLSLLKEYNKRIEKGLSKEKGVELMICNSSQSAVRQYASP